MAEEKYLEQRSLALNNLLGRKTLRNFMFRELPGQLSGGESSKQVVLREGHRTRPCPQSRGTGRSPAWASSSEVTPHSPFFPVVVVNVSLVGLCVWPGVSIIL